MIDFFKSHRLIRGSISILLALLLLPLYTFIAVVMESARYRSAQEQLGELTYLGEMAILADYVDFLANDYSIYAYNNKDLKDSFSKYMNKVTSSGGVDTRKLNKLFGVDIEKCELKYMYSVADPDVLAYQIRQNGRYALPLKVFNELVLGDLFNSLNKRLENVNKKLAIVKNSTGALTDSTNIIYEYQNMTNALDDLQEQLNAFESVRNALIEKKNKVEWNNINDALDPENKLLYKLFEDVYNIMNEDDSNVDLINARIESQRQIYNTFDGIQGAMDNYFKCSIEEKQALTVEIDTANLNITFDKVDQDGKVLCSEVLKKLADLTGVHDITNIDGYNRALSDIGNKIQNDEKLRDLYNSSQPLFEFINEYKKNDGYYAKLESLNSKYSEYIGAVDKMVSSFSSMVNNYDAANAALDAMSFEQDLKDLNEKGEQARVDRANYETSPDDLDDAAKAELESNMKKSADIRREAYQTARKNVNPDFANIGTNVLDKFLKEITTQTLGAWKTNLNSKYKGEGTEEPLLPNFKDVKNYNDFVKAVKKLQAYDFTVEYIKKYDFYTAHGSTPFDISSINDNGVDEILDFINDFKTDTDDRPSDDKEYISKSKLDIIYNVFVKASDNSSLADCSEKTKWFSVSDGDGSYYFSKQTIIMLFAFLVGSTFITEESGANKILSGIKTVLDTLGNLMPDDPSLNNHIGYQSNTKTLSSEYCTFPSEGSYYNNISMDPETDPKKIEERVRQISYEYVDKVIKDKNNFSINNYYINNLNRTNLYDFIFAGRQPGQSMQLLVDGFSGLLESTMDFIDSIYKFNIIKALDSIKKFIGSVENIINGIMTYYVDVCQIIAAVINDLSTGETKVLQYIFDQLYIGYYAANTFTSRQTAKGCDGDYGQPLSKNNCGGGCYDEKIIFDGAEIEYLLKGSPCEITNQHTAFYAVMILRFLLNFTMVAGDECVQSLTSVPFVGPVLLFVAVLAESNLDMMFLIGGVKVPLIKFKMSLNPENINNFIDSMTIAINNAQQKKMNWTMEKTENGDMYRKYKKQQSIDKTIDEKLQKSMGVGEGVGEGKNAKGIFPIDYNWYINILLLLYPEDVKLGRISDLIQMHGMEKKGTDFRLEKCYTYVYADVYADYSPLLPLLSGNRDSDPFPDIRSVQVNGY